MKSKIYFGPFLGEPGMEILFWIPYIRKYIKHNKIDSSDIRIISRGKVQAWYSDLHPTKYHDVFELLDRPVFVSGKHNDPIEQEIIKKLKISNYISPKNMFNNVFSQKVKDHQKWYDWLIDYYKDCYLPLQPDYPEQYTSFIEKLPENFITVKYYINRSIINEKKTTPLFEQFLDRCKLPIVSLDFENVIYDHKSLQIENTISLRDIISYKDNLQLQSYLIAKSKLFVGNFGGTQHIAVACGTPSITFTDHKKTVNTYATNLLNHYYPTVKQEIVDIDELLLINYE